MPSKLLLYALAALAFLGLFYQNAKLNKQNGAQAAQLTEMQSSLNEIAMDAQAAAKASQEVADRRQVVATRTQTIIREVNNAPQSTACVSSAPLSVYDRLRRGEDAEPAAKRTSEQLFPVPGRAGVDEPVVGLAAGRVYRSASRGRGRLSGGGRDGTEADVGNRT